MEHKLLSEDLADLIDGNCSLTGRVTRSDGSRLYWFSDRQGNLQRYATPRPEIDAIESVKRRWRNIRGLDPEIISGSKIPNAIYLDNDEI